MMGYGVTVTKVTVIAEEETATDAEYTSKSKMEFIGFKASSDNIPTGVANTSVSAVANLVLVATAAP